MSLAQRVVSEVFEPHRLTPDRQSALNAHLNAVQVGSLTLGYLDYGTTAQINLPPSDLWYHINVPLTGTSKVRREGGSTAHTQKGRSGAILVPHKNQTVEWKADTTQFALKIPRPDLERHLTQLTHRPVNQPLELGLELNLCGNAGAGLLRAIEFVTAEWDEDGVLVQNSHSRRHLESMVLTNLLIAASGPHQNLFNEENERTLSNTLTRTLDYIHDRASDLVTLTDLTRHSGVGLRTLQIQFKRHLGCTPLEYLRDVRLSAVRDELGNAQSDETTVTDVASRWGFYNLGRFSGIYRAKYGELPSETLRKARE